MTNGKGKRKAPSLQPRRERKHIGESLREQKRDREKKLSEKGREREKRERENEKSINLRDG